MGIYDRDYERDNYGRPPGIHLGGTRSLATNLVIVTFAVYAAQLLFGMRFTDLFTLHTEWFRRPWLFFELLTYGFIHSPLDITHVLFNMFGLWVFGRSVEERLGKKEFLVFYLVSIVVSGICWNLATLLSGDPAGGLLGASGAVSAVVILFICLFPNRTIMLYFAIPMPAWVLGVLFVVFNLFGAMNRQELDNIAYAAHLAGAAFGFIYFKSRWRLSDWLPTTFSMPKFRRGPKLRVHRPSQASEQEEDEVDEILRKIRKHGQDSLTSRERRVLEQASREYQRKRE